MNYLEFIATALGAGGLVKLLDWWTNNRRSKRVEVQEEAEHKIQIRAKSALVEDFAAMGGILGQQLADQSSRFTKEFEEMENRWRKRLDETDHDCVKKLNGLYDHIERLEADVRKIRQADDRD